MDVKDLILSRRSIRKYKEDLVETEKINLLLEAACSAPSACNKKPWEFYVVKNEKIKNELRKTTLFTNKNGKVAIVVCGNLKESLPKDMSEYWIQDCSAAVMSILLRVTDLNLGAVWCGLYPQKRGVERTRKILSLDEHIVPMALIWIGHKAEDPAPRDQYDQDKVHIIE